LKGFNKLLENWLWDGGWAKKEVLFLANMQLEKFKSSRFNSSKLAS